MTTIKVYHNPHFLAYRGDHNALIPPLHPIATVQVLAEATREQALETACSLTQHMDDGWWEQEAVLFHARSTSLNGHYHKVIWYLNTILLYYHHDHPSYPPSQKIGTRSSTIQAAK